MVAVAPVKSTILLLLFTAGTFLYNFAISVRMFLSNYPYILLRCTLESLYQYP